MARPRGDIRPRILFAASERFLVEGVDGASLRAIAKEAKTSIGMVYYYFPTKDDLFLAVVEERYGAFLTDLEAILGTSDDVETRLREMFLRISRLSEDEVRVMRTVVREVMVSTERRARIAERFGRGHLPLVANLIMQGVGAGQLSDQHPPAVMMVSVLTMALFPQLLRRLVGDVAPLARMLPEGEVLGRALCDVVLTGIRKTNMEQT